MIARTTAIHSRTRRTLARALLSTALALAMTGCSSDMSDLSQFVDQAKSAKRRPLPKPPELKPHETFTYHDAGLRDPFEVISFNQAQPGSEQQRSTSKLRPDESRPKEALEAFPLDSLRMVGVLEQQGSTWALVRASDGTIHRIRKGNYVGQNYGKITQISENEVDLVEIVPDGLGGYVERHAALALSE